MEWEGIQDGDGGEMEFRARARRRRRACHWSGNPIYSRNIPEDIPCDVTFSPSTAIKKRIAMDKPAKEPRRSVKPAHGQPRRPSSVRVVGTVPDGASPNAERVQPQQARNRRVYIMTSLRMSPDSTSQLKKNELFFFVCLSLFIHVWGELQRQDRLHRTGSY